MVGLQGWQGASSWLAVKRVQDNPLKFTLKQSKILSRDPQPLVTEGRITKGVCYNWCFGGLSKMCMVFVCAEDGPTSDYMEACRAEGWLAGASLQGWCCRSSGEAHLVSVPQSNRERGLLGSLARLGLAWWLGPEQCFGELPIMYVITGMLSQLGVNKKKKKKKGVFHLRQKCQSLHSDKMFSL